MRLQVGQSIDNNKVCLEFKRSPLNPPSTPTYSIDKNKADEFVKKYNAQDDKIRKITNGIVAGFSIVGIFAGMKVFMSKVSNKYTKSALTTIGSVLVGYLTSAIVSSKMKNKLMDKYDIEQIPKQK